MKDNSQFSSLSNELFLDILAANTTVLADMLNNLDDPRYAIDSYSPDKFPELIEKYSRIPSKAGDSIQISKEITKDLYIGVPRWTSPQLAYNVGTSVNQAAAAAYALALQQNVYNINDGLAGNTLVAEESVAGILSRLAKIEGESHGIFTFGGTATNLYGMKIGIKKAKPNSSRLGVGNAMKIFVTEDAHFSHTTCAEWLGIGSDNIITMKTDENGFTDLENMKRQLTDALDAGFLIGGIFINGGTTYDHIIDDIQGVVEVRNQLVSEYKLDYKPHIHVDSVIGWIWLFFADYDWLKNPLGMTPEALTRIQNQYEKIKHIKLADSWGVDFHKSIGGCPIDCSIVIINKLEDAMLLSRKSNGTSTHQLAAEYSLKSPVEYTLETSRASGAPLAALTALWTSGAEGYQKSLINLVEQAIFIRTQLSTHANIQVSNLYGSGFASIIRVLPADLHSTTYKDEYADNTKSGLLKSDRISQYTKSYFDWDYKNRVKKAKNGPEFSFSSKYTTLPNTAEMGVIKLYPVSPLFNKEYAEEMIDTITKGISLFELHQD